MSAHDPLKAQSLFARRYRILSTLGKGGAGAVYHARDESRGEEVALKVMHPALAESETQRLRFLREFRAVSRLDHPLCLRVFEEGRDGDTYFYSMEYVRGGDLTQHLKAPEAARLKLLYQIAQALEHIHTQRIVHRDLKPANVLVVERDGVLTPKLADFGIAKLLDAEQTLTAAGTLVGTLAYMAPEQFRDEALDARADLYALGCMIYVMWTGRPPFTAKRHPMQLVQAHLTQPPTPLRELAPTAPAWLEELAARLLLKDPQQRVQSAEEVVDWLGERLDVDAWRAYRASTRKAGAIYRPPLVGRDAELRGLVETLQAALSADPVGLGVALVAPAGMGKSRLVDAAVAELEIEQHARVIRVMLDANPDEPFAPFPALEAQATASVGDETARAIIDWDAPSMQPSPDDETLVSNHQLLASRAALRRTPSAPRRHATGRQQAIGASAAAPFRRPDRSSGGMASVDPAVARRRRVRDLVEALRPMAASEPVVLVLEDLHWMQPGAAAYLRDLLDALAETPGPRPALVTTWRPGEAWAALEDSARGALLERVTLRPLGVPEVQTIMQKMLGTEQPELVAQLSRALTEQTEGNPLFIQTCLQHLVAREVVQRRGARWELTPEVHATTLIPGSVAQLLRDRLSALRFETLEALRAASVLGDEFDFAALQRVSGIAEGELLDALDEALRAWIIEPVHGPNHLDCYAFEHAKLAEVLHGDLVPARARHLHRATAEVLAERPRTPAHLLAHHFAAAEDWSQAVTHLARAGDAAIEANDFETARQTYQEVLDRLASGVQAPLVDPLHVKERLSDALAALGQAHDALAQSQALLPLAHDPVTHSRWTRKHARNLYQSGQTRAGIERYQDALAAHDDPIPTTTLRLYWATALQLLAALWAGWRPRPPADPALALEHARLHRELMLLSIWDDPRRTPYHQLAYLKHAEHLGEDSLRVDAQAAHLILLILLGFQRRYERVRAEATRTARQTSDVSGLAWLHAYACVAEACAGDRQDFIVHRARALEHARASGDRFSLGIIVMWAGWLSLIYGDWSDAARLRAEALEIADLSANARLRVEALALGAITDWLTGADPRPTLDAARTSAAALDVPAFDGLLVEIEGGLAFREGRFDEAAALLADARDRYDAQHMLGFWGFFVHYGYSEAALWSADLQGASPPRAALSRMTQHAREARTIWRRLPRFEGMADVLEGASLARQGKRRAALHRLRRGVLAREHLSDDYITGWLLLRAAVELHRFNAPADEVQRHLRRAVALFEANPMDGLMPIVHATEALIADGPQAAQDAFDRTLSLLHARNLDDEAITAQDQPAPDASDTMREVGEVSAVDTAQDLALPDSMR